MNKIAVGVGGFALYLIGLGYAARALSRWLSSNQLDYEYRELMYSEQGQYRG